MSTITRSVKSEQAIYKTYRAALTSLRKASNSRDSRSAERRQRARQIVCERYKVSHAIVKDIVARKDQEAGITHEHTPQYLAMLELQKARKESEKAIDVSIRYGKTSMEPSYSSSPCSISSSVSGV